MLFLLPSREWGSFALKPMLKADVVVPKESSHSAKILHMQISVARYEFLILLRHSEKMIMYGIVRLYSQSVKVRSLVSLFILLVGHILLLVVKLRLATNWKKEKVRQLLN